MDLPLNAMTPRMRRTLVAAARFAKASGQGHIGTEHVLLALASDGDGLAGQALTRLGVREDVQTTVRELIEESRTSSGGGEAPGHPDDAVRVDFDPALLSNHPLRLRS